MTTYYNPRVNPHPSCNHRNLSEVRLSDCSHGCKIYRCKECGTEMLIHYEGYGCLKTEVEFM